MNHNPPDLSIIVPALNEQDNVLPLVERVDQTLCSRGLTLELIVVDDGSTDQTCARLLALQSTYPWVIVLSRSQPQGQSAAMYAGIHAARAPFIATLDADLQNDPADLYDMLQTLQQKNVDLVQGDRSHDRQDNIIRRLGSIVGRYARRLILNDPIRDTGCSARVMRREIALQLPLQFKGMHRFVPAYTRMLGGRITETPVHHSPRRAGETKYGLGLLNRGFAGFFDCLAVRWMTKRHRDVTAEQPKDTH